MNICFSCPKVFVSSFRRYSDFFTEVDSGRASFPDDLLSYVKDFVKVLSINLNNILPLPQTPQNYDAHSFDAKIIIQTKMY